MAASRAKRTKSAILPRVSVAGPNKAAVVQRVRDVCASLPQVTERDSHGSPGFFINDKPCFMYVTDNHHNDGRFALWCAAPDGMQKMLVDSDPDRYFVPPYVGPSGWVGVRLDRNTPWKQIASIIENAYVAKAPPKVLAVYRGEPISGGARRSARGRTPAPATRKRSTARRPRPPAR